MKKFFFSMTLLLSLCACSKESSSSEDFVTLDTIVCTRTVSFSAETKAGTIEPVVLSFATSYNINEDKVTSLSISSTDPDLDVVGLKEMVKDKFAEEYGFPLENSDLNILMEAASAEDPDGSTAECFSKCDEKKKGEGRGWCRAGCIIDLVVEVVEVLLDFFKK